MTWFSSFAMFFQILLNGIFVGCMYGVAAIGLSLIFGCMQIIFIAQGSVMILAAYCIFWMFSITSASPFWGFSLSYPCFCCSVGPCMPVFSRGSRKPVKTPPFSSHSGLWCSWNTLWDGSGRPTSELSLPRLLDIVIRHRRRQRFGHSSNRGLRDFHCNRSRLPVSEEDRPWQGSESGFRGFGAAALLGISQRSVSAVTFSIGIALAGIAGVATSLVYPFDPYFGFLFGLKALIAVAFGGLGSVGGALLGGIILGVLESLTSYVVSAGWADAVAYGAFLLVLIFRPQGLFGRLSGDKA